MAKRTVFRVAVSYGTWQGYQTYAAVPTRRSAEILTECAKKLGYHDAHIQEREVEDYARREREDGPEDEGGGPDPPRPHVRGREMRNLREDKQSLCA